jgi:hypothetical protein
VKDALVSRTNLKVIEDSPAPGSYFEINNFAYDATVQNVINYLRKVYNYQDIYVRIVKVFKQLVAGFNYRFNINLIYPNGGTFSYIIIVYEDLQRSLRIT